MDRFCPMCGAPIDGKTAFCINCGAPLGNPQPSPYQAAQSAPQRRTRPAPPANPLVHYIKSYLKIIILVVAVFSLICGIMNLFGTYDVEATVSFAGEEDSSSGPISDVREDTPDDLVLYALSTYVMGIVGFAAFGLASYTIYLLLMNAPGSKKFFSLTALVGTVGTAVALLMALFGNSMEMMGAEMSFSIHFTYWVALILYAGLLCVDKILLKKRYAPLK